MIGLYCKKCGSQLMAENDKSNEDVDQPRILVTPCRACDSENRELRRAIRIVLGQTK